MRSRVIELPQRLDPLEAGALAQAILAKRGAPLDLKVGKVERVATPALQVLLSAAVTWRADGHRLRLTGRSEALEEAARTLGLALDAFAAEGTAP